VMCYSCNHTDEVENTLMFDVCGVGHHSKYCKCDLSTPCIVADTRNKLLVKAITNLLTTDKWSTAQKMAEIADELKNPIEDIKQALAVKELQADAAISRVHQPPLPVENKIAQHKKSSKTPKTIKAVNDPVVQVAPPPKEVEVQPCTSVRAMTAHTQVVKESISATTIQANTSLVLPNQSKLPLACAQPESQTNCSCSMGQLPVATPAVPLNSNGGSRAPKRRRNKKAKKTPINGPNVSTNGMNQEALASAPTESASATVSSTPQSKTKKAKPGPTIEQLTQQAKSLLGQIEALKLKSDPSNSK
jgi:hypothetical protein